MVSYWKLNQIERTLATRSKTELKCFTPSDVIHWMKTIGYHHTYSAITITRYLQTLDKYVFVSDPAHNVQSCFKLREGSD